MALKKSEKLEITHRYLLTLKLCQIAFTNPNNSNKTLIKAVFKIKMYNQNRYNACDNS